MQLVELGRFPEMSLVLTNLKENGISLLLPLTRDTKLPSHRTFYSAPPGANRPVIPGANEIIIEETENVADNFLVGRVYGDGSIRWMPR